MFRLKLHAAMFALVIGLLTAFNQTARAQAACTTNPVVVNVLDAGAGSLPAGSD